MKPFLLGRLGPIFRGELLLVSGSVTFLGKSKDFTNNWHWDPLKNAHFCLGGEFPPQNASRMQIWSARAAIVYARNDPEILWIVCADYIEHTQRGLGQNQSRVFFRMLKHQARCSQSPLVGWFVLVAGIGCWWWLEQRKMASGRLGYIYIGDDKLPSYIR